MFGRKKDRRLEEAESIEETSTQEITTTAPKELIEPIEHLGRPVIQVQAMAGFMPVKIPVSQLDRKTELQYLQMNSWCWIDKRHFSLHDDGTAVVWNNKEAYLDFPKHICTFREYVKVLKLECAGFIVIAAEPAKVLLEVKGGKTLDYSGCLIRGNVYPVMALTDELKEKHREQV